MAPDATLQDVWRLLVSMDRRINERFDATERHLVATTGRFSGVEASLSGLEARIGAKLDALKEAIEARDHRLDDHARRLTKLEESRS